MMEKIQTIESNKWIRNCKGPWGSMILLTPKPYQEEVTNIKDFVQRLYVSYYSLNTVTQSFTFLIPCCADSIENFGDSNGLISFIILDDRQVCNWISFLFYDQKKIAFFTQDGSKNLFVVMPFVPKNSPSF